MAQLPEAITAYNDAVTNTHLALVNMNAVAALEPFDIQAYALATNAFTTAKAAEDKALVILQGTLNDNPAVAALQAQLSVANTNMQQRAASLSTTSQSMKDFASAASAVVGVLVQIIPFLI